MDPPAGKPALSTKRTSKDETIGDIAQAACYGLASGTVDRILHMQQEIQNKSESSTTDTTFKKPAMKKSQPDPNTAQSKKQRTD